MASSSGLTWRQGDRLTLTIESLCDSGDGLGRAEGRVVFVPDTVPGDHIQAKLLQVRSRYARAELEEVLEASPDRIRPACIVADKCGGCQWQTVDYPAQVEAKTVIVQDALQRLGQLSAEVQPTIAAPYPLGYRNKVSYPLRRSDRGEVQAGYFRKGSHRLINLNQCPVQDQRLDPLLAGIKADIAERDWPIYDEQTRSRGLRHLGLRIGQRTGEILITLIATDDQLPEVEAQAEQWLTIYPDVVGVCLNLNPTHGNRILGDETLCLAGRPYLIECLDDLEFAIGPETFFQVNTEQAERLLPILKDFLRGSDRLFDLYCGVGTLTLPLASEVGSVLGLEILPESVAQAQQNADRNGITNVEFQAGAVETLLAQIPESPDAVLLDPPRKGCEPAVIEVLRDRQPQRIAYVSCNPATLARDLQALCAGDRYRLLLVQPLDFFPQTAHVETVALLEWQD
ncbi:23S rRNA (uracil(1939)-C(5))-methyltransferase RlmD [Synechococcus elongatus]|uniref:23S rRNA (uracil(1939)-C(5))-methyltransferase RlmD n=1 Tax=Synechococcus elongatus TaxID=32046 RepID=UPI0030CAE6EC